MSHTDTTLQDPALEQAELATLKARATLMGLAFHPSIGADKLREKIAVALAEAPPVAAVAPAVSAAPPPVIAPVETEGQRRKRRKNEANRLIRIRLTCMNPAKKDWDGEIITTGNALVGTIAKYIPFTAEEGWHVPYMLYQVLTDRQCQVFTTVKSKNGVSVRQGKLIKEFAIEVLDPLTPTELSELARRQAMAKGQD